MTDVDVLEQASEEFKDAIDHLREVAKRICKSCELNDVGVNHALWILQYLHSQCDVLLREFDASVFLTVRAECGPEIQKKRIAKKRVYCEWIRQGMKEEIASYISRVLDLSR